MIGLSLFAALCTACGKIDNNMVSDILVDLSEEENRISQESRDAVEEADHNVKEPNSKFYIQEVLTNYILDSSDKIWVHATEIREGDRENITDYYMLTDLKGNIYKQVEIREGGSWANNSGDAVIVTHNYNKNEYCVQDTEGNDLTSRYCRQGNEEIIGVDKGSSEITIWTRRTEESFEVYNVYLRAYDIDGNLKGEWASEQIKLEFGFKSVYFAEYGPKHIGGSVWKIGTGYIEWQGYSVYLDMENGKIAVMKEYTGTSWDSNDGNYTLHYQDNNLQILYKGEIICTGIHGDVNLYPQGDISEGCSMQKEIIITNIAWWTIIGLSV